ncbi:HAD superfamily hydrolase [Candidatus Mancarchaeum acidiphilum]|uniref:HAD superfamily hydrolase n=1 Tax=Candidatus Mancarchaeum acidiphilum TaxID=1920749 RepID=A0A218NN49_9ARCH|nr:HAD-IA family hydrolase [Candidatus Mancarchaeum acidiphilum]ASI13874.1 HAD superfamily hydrolase [Candidatus Mancarchaeum acidiphilum]
MRGLAEKYDTFIFDWDGTIITTTELRKLDSKLDFRLLFKRRESMKHLGNVKNEVKNSGSLLYKIYFRDSRKMRKVERDIKNKVYALAINIVLSFTRPRLHNGVREMLQEMNDKGKTVAVFTNGNVDRIMKEAEMLKIGDYFTAMLSAQSVNRLKPNPLGLEVLIKGISADKKRTLYIGDMVDDIVTAKRAGVASCAIADGLDRKEDLKESDPTYIFRSMEEFKKHI